MQAAGRKGTGARGKRVVEEKATAGEQGRCRDGAGYGCRLVSLGSPRLNSVGKYRDSGPKFDARVHVECGEGPEIVTREGAGKLSREAGLGSSRNSDCGEARRLAGVDATRIGGVGRVGGGELQQGAGCRGLAVITLLRGYMVSKPVLLRIIPRTGVSYAKLRKLPSVPYGSAQSDAYLASGVLTFRRQDAPTGMQPSPSRLLVWLDRLNSRHPYRRHLTATGALRLQTKMPVAF